MVQQKDVMASSPKKRTAEEPVVLHIWDFAGHDLYYTTHQVCLFRIFCLNTSLFILYLYSIMNFSCSQKVKKGPMYVGTQ